MSTNLGRLPYFRKHKCPDCGVEQENHAHYMTHRNEVHHKILVFICEGKCEAEKLAREKP